jgi:hypothetical protein
MMSHQEWLRRIVTTANQIASRDFQEEAWFPGGKVRSSPEEEYLTLIEDLTFDLFYEKYGNGFTEQQVERWSDLRQRLEKYYDRLPKNPDPRKVLDDPEWEAVRQSARRFVEVFSKPDDNARELLK